MRWNNIISPSFVKNTNAAPITSISASTMRFQQRSWLWRRKSDAIMQTHHFIIRKKYQIQSQIPSIRESSHALRWESNIPNFSESKKIEKGQNLLRQLITLHHKQPQITSNFFVKSMRKAVVLSIHSISFVLHYIKHDADWSALKVWSSW